MNDFPPAVQHNIIDTGALVVILSSFAGWLPSIAAAFAIAWYAIQIAESKTVRRLFGLPEKRKRRPRH